MFDLHEIWSTMGWANRAITIFIALMAVLSIAITIERVIAFSKSATISRAFAARAQGAIKHWNMGQLLELTQTHRASSLGRLFEAITLKYLDVCERGEVRTAGIDMVRNESARQQEAIGADLRRGMSVLATIGSITPFVGLLGTVIGIIAAFSEIGSANSAGIGAVSVKIGEALVETALGLAVAIPAVIFFNYLTGRVGAIEAALGRSAGQLIDEMEFRHADTQQRESGPVETRQAA
jgi:biopolymer transport protein ExbB